MDMDLYQLREADAKHLYKEPLSKDEDGNLVFRKGRMFQKYIGVQKYTDDTKILVKGARMEVFYIFPNVVPKPATNAEGKFLVTDLKNWYQVALGSQFKTVPDPLSVQARYRGFLPGRLDFEPAYKTAQFHLMVNKHDVINRANYALYIYDQADYADFLRAVEELLGEYRNMRAMDQVVDAFGNSILVSDSSTTQPMLLFPAELLIGGSDFLGKAWEDMLEAWQDPLDVA